jgi:hypothetical protein
MVNKLRVGFDLDGVLLYNPARIVRPIIAQLKKKQIAFNRRELEFYVPQPGPQQLFWELLHKSSMCLAPGFKQLVKLKEEGAIEPYLITGRFGHLQANFENWKKKMQADEVFVNCYMNGKNEQPHLFKERLIKELQLDVFVEDNWDIVRYLDEQCRLRDGQICATQVIWVSNMLDFRIKYPSKVTSLKQALEIIEKRIRSNE